MGEYIGASIQFGGKLRAAKIDELLELLNDKGLRANWDGKPTADNLNSEMGCSEVNYGLLDELEDFGKTNGLHYSYWCDSGPDWSASTTIYNPETGESCEILEGQAITRHQIKELGSMEAIEAYFDKFTTDLPPLEIVP